MPWKKAWPSELKDALRREGGIYDEHVIETLEGYRSLEDFMRDRERLLTGTQREKALELMKQHGVV